MKSRTKEQTAAFIQHAIELLAPLGWEYTGELVRFRKDGKVYDLSAANLGMVNEIERRGQFLVQDDPHPYYGPCDAMGFKEGECAECEKSLPPEEYKARQALHYWKNLKNQLARQCVDYFNDLPLGSKESFECGAVMCLLTGIMSDQEAANAL